MKKILLLSLMFLGQHIFAQETNHLKIADSLILNGRYKQAILLLENDSLSYKANVKLGNIYYQTDQTKRAIDYYLRALKIKELNATKVLLGKAYQKIRKPAKAIEVYEEIVDNDPDNLLIKYQLGKLYISQRRAGSAVKLFDTLLVQDSTNANYAYQKGRALALLQKRDPMINSFIDAYKIDSTHISAVYQLANSFFKLNDKDSTNLFLSRGLELDSMHRGLNSVKARVHFRAKEYDKAIPVLLKLDSIRSNDIGTLNMLAKSYYNIDSLRLAKETFEIIKQLDRKEYKTSTYLGHIAMKQEQYDKAFMHYLMATSIGKTPRDEEYYSLANVYLKQEKPLKAIKMFKEARKQNSGNYKALFHLAKTSDDYYKDKKQVYTYYKDYISWFEDRDADFTAFAQNRLKEIKKEYFLRGEKIE